MRKINKIILHCSDTPTGRDVRAKDIRRWHVVEQGWADIGYHYVICRDGTIEPGRAESVIGAHAYGHNSDSIGICMVGGTGGCDFTRLQWKALDLLVSQLEKRYPGAEVIGHNDVSSKECPSFDAKAWSRD